MHREPRLPARVFLGACLFVAACTADPTHDVGRSAAAVTFPNDEAGFDYFRARGLTPVQAAGVIGNLDVESGMDPTAVQGGGPGRGIAQWSTGARWDTTANDNAKDYATQSGQSRLSLSLQLDFIWYELTTFPSYGLTKLSKTTTVSSAVLAFQTDFEACGSCSQSQRIAYGNAVLAAFGGDVVDAFVPNDASGNPACTVTATGLSGECLDVSACAALGDHVSTPGSCSGPNNIQCCTAKVSSPSDASVSAQLDAGTSGDAAGGCDLSGVQARPALALSMIIALVALVLRRAARRS